MIYLLRAEHMTKFGGLLIALFVLVGWLLCLANRETKQDFAPRYRKHHYGPEQAVAPPGPGTAGVGKCKLERAE